MAYWIDRLTQGIAPRWTLNRIRARAAADILARHYEAASSGRRTSSWTKTGGDANAVNASAISILRQHARDLVRNNPFAESALTTIADHAVGWGITAKPARTAPEPVRKRTLDWWKAWADSTACDADGRENLYGLQKLVMRTVAESGEVLIRRRLRRPEDNLPLPVQLQVLEPDYLDPLKENQSLPNGGRILQGIEFDPIGRRVAYWLFRTHPGAVLSGATGYGQSDRIPASEILHIYKRKRPGQIRGASWFAPVILRLKDFDTYEDAALMKQKIAACLAVITSDVDGSAPTLGAADTEDATIDTLEPGMILNAPPGRSINVVQPPTISEHQQYAATVLRAIATGLGLTYEDLTGDYCMAPETRVLRADFRWVRADTLKPGDKLVAFDEDRPGKRQFRKHRQAEVMRLGRRDLPRITVKTNRAAISVSSEHAFLCIRPTKGTGTKWKMHQWVKAEDLIPGDQILYLADPWEEGRTHTHGYLKGIADGEGWCDKRRGSVGISQKPGPTHDEIGSALKALGFHAGDRNANGNGLVAQWDMNRMAEAMRFLGEVRPARLLEKARHVYEGKAVAGGKGKRTIYAQVLSAEPEGVGPVVTLETTTHTVITEGMYSHNTNMPFSAARMSRLRHWARVEDWRWNMLIPQFCDPVWRWAMEAAGVMGLDAATAAEWSCPPPPIIEPQAEAAAYRELIRIGAITWPEMVRERAYDPTDVLAEIADTNKKFDALGIILDCDPRRTSQQGQPSQPAKGSASDNGNEPDREPAAATAKED